MSEGNDVTNLNKLLDEPARHRIEAAVASAEARTSGEIVPVIVLRSSEYPEARLFGALLGAGLGALIELAVTRGTSALSWLLVAEGCGMVLGYWASAWAPLLRRLAGKAALARRTRERAMRAFLDFGLARTAGATGVLVFASLLEREVVVLGDRAIHEKMGDKEWQRAVAALVQGLSRGSPAEGFCDAIAIVGDKLAEHFPRRQDDVDELPNRLEVQDR